MTSVSLIKHEFVKTIPEVLNENTIYISVEYGTAVHKCMCGCGEEVVTPLTPVDWSICYDGDTVSLRPSIGNWSQECRSHYWITESKVRWAESWSGERVRSSREQDTILRKAHYSGSVPSTDHSFDSDSNVVSAWFVSMFKKIKNIF